MESIPGLEVPVTESPPDAVRQGRRAANLTRPVAQIFLEAFLVALGVVLALAANEWRQGALARETADEALKSIHTELVFNRAALDSAMIYHSATVDSLRSSMRAGETPSYQVFSRGYIAPALLQSHAWDTARETNALAPLPYEQVLEISRIYSLMAGYETQKEFSGRVIYETMFREGPAAILSRPSNLMSIIYTFIYKERLLLGEFDAFLLHWDEAESSKL